MAYINLGQTVKLIRLNTLNAMIGNSASITLFDGIYPMSPDVTVTTNHPLANFACNDFGFGNVAVVAQTLSDNSVINVVTLTSSFFSPAIAFGNGVVGWARISDVNGNAIVDLDVGLANTSIVMNATDLIQGIPVQIVGVTITEQ